MNEVNKGRAIELYNQLQGEGSHDHWIRVIVACLRFLLARYIDKD